MIYDKWFFVKKEIDAVAPEWLQMQRQKSGTAYRIYYVKLGYSIRRGIQGKFSHWRDAEKVGDELLTKLKKQEKEKPGVAGKISDEVLNSDLVIEIMKDKESENLSDATLDLAEIMYRVHIIPFLGGWNYTDNTHRERIWVDGVCPLAKDLAPSVWRDYKTQFSKKNPDSPLFNHWKAFVTLFKKARLEGLIDKEYILKHNEKKEGKRKKGQLIPDDIVQKMISKASTQNWKHRIIIQRFTGMRPGEVRNLRKIAIGEKLRNGQLRHLEPNIIWNGDAMTLSLQTYDTKTRTAREFIVKSEFVKKTVIDQMARYPESPYLFPNERDNSKPMDKSLNGWDSTLSNAGVTQDYTPHDLRHTYLTEMFKVSNKWATVCYQAGLTLEEAQETYLHFSSEDTHELAEIMAKKELTELADALNEESKKSAKKSAKAPGKQSEKPNDFVMH